MILKQQVGRTPTIPRRSTADSSNQRIAMHIYNLFLQVFPIRNQPGIMFPILLDMETLPVIQQPNARQAFVELQKGQTGLPCSVQDKVNMVIHQTKANDLQLMFLPYRCQAKRNTVHPSDKFPLIQKEDRFHKSLGGAMMVMRVMHFLHKVTCRHPGSKVHSPQETTFHHMLCFLSIK